MVWVAYLLFRHANRFHASQSEYEVSLVTMIGLEMDISQSGPVGVFIVLYMGIKKETSSFN